MDIWPWDIELGAQTSVAIEAFGKALTVERLNPSTLRYQYGDDPGEARLIGVSETTDLLRFVPTLGPIPLLIFPNTHLLCPAGSTARCYLRLPLHLQVGVGEAKSVKRIADLTPPTVSRALYGPVDAGTLCTSIHANNAPEINHLEESFGESAHAQLATRPIEVPAAPADTEDVVFERELFAYTLLRARNTTEEPLEVSKIMVPAATVGLFHNGSHILTNEVVMRLRSEQEAELDFRNCPDSSASAICDLQGRRSETAPQRTHFFSHTYRSKTGLEFGF